MWWRARKKGKIRRFVKYKPFRITKLQGSILKSRKIIENHEAPSVNFKKLENWLSKFSSCILSELLSGNAVLDLVRPLQCLMSSIHPKLLFWALLDHCNISCHLYILTSGPVILFWTLLDHHNTLRHLYILSSCLLILSRTLLCHYNSLCHLYILNSSLVMLSWAFFDHHTLRHLYILSSCLVMLCWVFSDHHNTLRHLYTLSSSLIMPS